jgi:hypothetical protein
MCSTKTKRHQNFLEKPFSYGSWGTKITITPILSAILRRVGENQRLRCLRRTYRRCRMTLKTYSVEGLISGQSPGGEPRPQTYLLYSFHDILYENMSPYLPRLSSFSLVKTIGCYLVICLIMGLFKVKQYYVDWI